MLSVVPELTVHYHHATIRAKEQPFEFIEFMFRKSSHLFIYAVLAAVSCWAIIPLKRIFTQLLLVLMYVALIACADEWNQMRSVQRTSAIQDVVLDVSGGLLGLIGFLTSLFLIHKIRRGRTLRRGEVRWQRK